MALFTGFLAGAGAGMDILNAELAASGIPDYEGLVFDWNQKQQAFDWIDQATAGRSTLVLIGHSFGGNSTLQLANNFLKPVGIDVDLTIQVDSVENFDGGWNNLLPTNVEVGFNYYQISGGGFGDFQGEMNVQGATNINAEVLFNDTSITHTSLDNDPRLHDEIEQNILDNLNTQDADFDHSGLVDGLDFLKWQVGMSPNPLSQSDLALWESQFGGPPPVGSVSAVPDPATFLFAALAGMGLLVRRL